MDARTLAWTFAPQTMAERAVTYERGVRRRWGATQLAERWFAEHGDVVQAGPVSGTRYFTDGDAAVAKIIGAYEIEIHDWLREALRTAESFVDMGAADGYYAVGVARCYPTIPVTAYELSKTQRVRLEALANTNQTAVTLVPRASGRALRRVALDGAVVLCDIEGGEDDVLRGETIRLLRGATVIVETHDAARPGVSQRLKERFAATHHVTAIIPIPRNPADFPQLADLNEQEAQLALDEHRGPGQSFLRMTPR